VPKHRVHHASTRARKATLTRRERAALRAASRQRGCTGGRGTTRASAELQAARHERTGPSSKLRRARASTSGPGHAVAGRARMGERAERAGLGRAGTGAERAREPRRGRAGAARAGAPRQAGAGPSAPGTAAERAGAGEPCRDRAREPSRAPGTGRASALGPPWPATPGRGQRTGSRHAAGEGATCEGEGPRAGHTAPWPGKGREGFTAQGGARARGGSTTGGGDVREGGRERFWGEGEGMTGGAHRGVAAMANSRARGAGGRRLGRHVDPKRGRGAPSWAAAGPRAGVGGQAAPGGKPPGRDEKPAQRGGGEEGISLFQFLPIIYSISNLLLRANFMETKRIHPKVN
jgi:hypothetical protein